MNRKANSSVVHVMKQFQILGHFQFVKYLGVASVLSLITAACGGYGSSTTSTTVGSSGSSSATSKVSASYNAALGQKILVDSSGRTLYLFEKDTGGKSLCTGGCASAWPPLLTKGKVQAGTGISTSLLGTINRGNGDMQATYNGHPLYTFSGDSRPGQTNGEGLTAFGARWYAVSAQGSAVIAKSTSSGSSGAYGSGGPYG